MLTGWEVAGERTWSSEREVGRTVTKIVIYSLHISSRNSPQVPCILRPKPPLGSSEHSKEKEDRSRSEQPPSGGSLTLLKSSLTMWTDPDCTCQIRLFRAQIETSRSMLGTVERLPTGQIGRREEFNKANGHP